MIHSVSVKNIHTVEFCSWTTCRHTLTHTQKSVWPLSKAVTSAAVWAASCFLRQTLTWWSWSPESWSSSLCYPWSLRPGNNTSTTSSTCSDDSHPGATKTLVTHTHTQSVFMTSEDITWLTLSPCRLTLTLNQIFILKFSDLHFILSPYGRRVPTMWLCYQVLWGQQCEKKHTHTDTHTDAQ